MAEMAGEIGAFGAGAAAGAAVGGFAGAGEALGAAGAKTSQLKEQVASGALRIDPQVALEAAKYCRDQAEEVQFLLEDYRQIANLEGLGDYDTSVALTHHFTQKAKQDEGGALALLDSLQREMIEQAKLFEEAAKDYESRDEQIGADLGKGVQ
ncbi:hypothetical protein GIY23_16430 [Allosaccharopolyspora coralli]|uniref:PE domain-containing protein n=1 Tax=Allosaccharopolyspora coralli TaxID=2665642 RepID=A0A5Q3QAK3_9PSEU|nr:hypothetical protein [Allosaccharopolyspora coralli]QGK70890.1 hypothetical protein GIY23_16430 [Allosaccharopolyspora coralli]